jgi:predicted lysophospholipase L1 biosynthesis ABC-type transport system permease subunit
MAGIGVRVALGASRSRMRSMILGDVGRLLIAGVMVGSLLAPAAGRAIGSLLFGLEPYDTAPPASIRSARYARTN